MISTQKLSLSLFTLALLLDGCTTYVEQTTPERAVSACHVIYDAGSSRTRLYIYEKTNSGWVKHHGPRTGALADPVRGNRGKSMTDAGQVVGDIVTALEDMRSDGPVNKNGKPGWPAFDWQEFCRIDSVAVYATAGMRLAEQQDAEASEMLWEMLNDKLSAALGKPVVTRTITGFEEGLFAWLAIREGQGDGAFGVTEMGGASVQVTFPCPECETSRPVKVKGQFVPVYSQSFLGWGQDDAWKKYKPMPACARGAGINNPDWQLADCAAPMGEPSVTADEIRGYLANAGEMRWYLSGAFRSMQDTDIDNYCRQGINSGFEPKTSCFRAVYLQEVLDRLGVPVESEKSDVDWTLGAVICTDTQCYETL
jgi:hypothetical protein